MESSSSSTSSSTSSQRMHRQISEMTSTSSSELQNSQLLQQRLQMENAAVADVADVTDLHMHRRPSTDIGGGSGDPLVTFPESPPVLVSNVSPLQHASAARPKPLRVNAAAAADGQQAYAASSSATERRVSTSSKLVKEAYESSSSNSSSCSSTVSDTQDVLQSFNHGAADVRKLHAANAIRARLSGTIADHGTEKTLNRLQVCILYI